MAPRYRSAVQVPSWALFEGYKKYKSKYQPIHKFREVITASPDWDPEEEDDDGTPLYSERDKQKMIVQKAKESANPETFKVENRGKFAEVTDAYLNPVDGRPHLRRKAQWLERRGPQVLELSRSIASERAPPTASSTSSTWTRRAPRLDSVSPSLTMRVR
jgi:hypothetical protein